MTSWDDATDAQVIARSQDDADAFGLLFDRYAPQLHRFVVRRLGVSAADDITADTFLIAFRSRAGFDRDRDSARPWLYGIATRLISRHRRSEARGLRAYARSGHDPVAESWVDSADDRLVADAAGRELAAALAALAPGDRNVLLLVAWAEFSYAEVAEALGIPVGTVRSRLHRARRQSRQSFGTGPSTTMQEA